MDKALQRQQTAERVKRYRDKQKSVTSEVALQGSVTPYPAFIMALADPVKREKIERILESLKGHSGVNLENIWYGINGPNFKQISKLISP